MEKKISSQPPTKKETLAGKYPEKIQRWRLTRFGSTISGFSPRWWVITLESASILLIFLLNLWLLWPFFGREDQVNVFSAPFIPVLAAITQVFIPYSYGVRIWLLVFLIFFPVSFYYFSRAISGRKLTALLASSIVILPVGIFLPVRATLGLLSEDGAHMASLTVSLIVCLLLLKFLRRGSFWSAALTALGVTLVALTSPIGGVVLLILMGVITFSEMLLGQGRLKLIRFLAVLVLAAGFSAFWYNPKFILLTLGSSHGQLVKKTLFNLLPVSFFLAPILGVFGFLLFENRPQFQPMFIAFFLTVVFGLFSLGAGLAQTLPSRFLPAFGLSLAFLAGLAVVWLFDFLSLSPRAKKLRSMVPHFKTMIKLALGLILILIFLFNFLLGRGFRQKQKLDVLGLTVEEKVGVWEIREKTSGIADFVGYGITAAMIFSAGVLGIRFKKERIN